MSENLHRLILNLTDGVPLSDNPNWRLLVEGNEIHSTNWICDELFHSRSEGMKVIREAEKAGYIKRYRRRIYGDKLERYYVLNYLTPKGKQLRHRLRTENQHPVANL